MILRLLLGLLLAAIVAFGAYRSHSLTAGGSVAAACVGGAALSAGWGWGALLIVFFIASTWLSRVGQVEKERRTLAIVQKGGARDAVQVLANGALLAGAALAMAWLPSSRWLALGAGSLAAATADTWGTEIGTLVGGPPHSILTWRRVPPGTSGGVTIPGTLATLAGAGFIALWSVAFGWRLHIGRLVFLGGVAGALVDSVLGATLQSGRWCDACAAETERRVHHCGTATRANRGLSWMDNDVVNFLSNAAGGLVAALLIRLRL